MTNKETTSLTQITIKPDIAKTIVVINVPTQKAISKVIRSANAIEHIEDDKQFHAADVLVGQIHALDKELKAQRKQVKDPLLQAGRLIDAACKPHQLMLKEAKNRVATHVASYRKHIEEEAAILRAKQLEEERAREIIKHQPVEDFPEIPEQQPLFVPTPIVPKSANVKTVSKRTVVIDASKLPKTFKTSDGEVHTLLIPDTVLINQLVFGGEAIPGCKIEITENAQVK